MRSETLFGFGLAALVAASSCSRSAQTRSDLPPAVVEQTGILEMSVAAPLETTLAALRRALADQGFDVLDEADLGVTMAASASRLRDDYNRSGLEQIRSITFCPVRFVNALSNEDPRALALCPLHITLFEKDSETTVLFARPSTAASDTKAASSVIEVERRVVAAIERATADAPVAQGDGKCRFDTECSGERVCEQHHCVRWWQLHGDTPAMDANTVYEMARTGQVQILDVRTPAEYAHGHIEGALSVPLGKLEDARFELPVDRQTPVVAVCLTAHRSDAAVRLLKRLGYDVVELAGGMLSWRKAGLPETREAPASASP